MVENRLMDPLDPYPSPERRDRALTTCVERARGECIVYGTSCEGRPLVAGRLPSPTAGAPRVLVTANIHGPEYASSQVALGVLDALAGGAGAAAALRARAEVWVVPCVNPDGYARTWSRGGEGP